MSQLKLSTIAAPVAPPVGQVTLYAKADKKLYYKDSTGLESNALGVPSSGTRYHIIAAETITVQPRDQYLVKGPFTVDPGGALVLSPTAILVVL